MGTKKSQQEAMWFAKDANTLFRSEDIPQANSLPKVRELVAAVNAGIATPAGLRDALKLDDRHVAYYRRAAVILGVVAESDDGLAVTPTGKNILAAPAESTQERKEFREAVRRSKPLAPFRSFFEGADVDLDDVAHRIGIMTGLSKATADRRAQTLLAWRKFLGESEAESSEAKLPDVQKVIAKQIETHNALAIETYLKKLLKQPPKKFEELIGALVSRMGYSEVVVTGRAGDGGVDVRAVRTDPLSGHKTRVAMQAKRYRNNVARAHVDQMIGVMTREQCNVAYLITTADFSKAARAAAAQYPGLQLVDGTRLIGLLVEHEVTLRRGEYGAISEISAPVKGAKKPTT